MLLLVRRNVAEFIVVACLFVEVTCNQTYFTDYMYSNDSYYADEPPSLYSSDSSGETKTDQPESPDPSSQNGLIKFRGSSLPATPQPTGSHDDYILSLDMLMPSAPRSYDVKVNQEGFNSINSNFVSKTMPSTVKQTDISLQFNPKKLYSVEIKIEFEIEDEPSPPDEPITYSMADSPTMSQTVMSEGAAYYGSKLENYLLMSQQRDTYPCADAEDKKCKYPFVLSSVGGSTASLFRQEKQVQYR